MKEHVLLTDTNSTFVSRGSELDATDERSFSFVPTGYKRSLSLEAALYPLGTRARLWVNYLVEVTQW